MKSGWSFIQRRPWTQICLQICVHYISADVNAPFLPVSCAKVEIVWPSFIFDVVEEGVLSLF